MIEHEAGIQELKQDTFINEFELSETRKSISDYLEKVKSADIGQVKFYLGVLYFVALLVFSFTLFF